MNAPLFLPSRNHRFPHFSMLIKRFLVRIEISVSHCVLAQSQSFTWLRRLQESFLHNKQFRPPIAFLAQE